MNQRYKTMLQGMRQKDKKNHRKKQERWFLYMLRCSDNSLYTGIAKDIEKRFQMHSKGKGARYTRTRLPLKLVYQKQCKSRTEALIRECVVKSLPKAKKILLINQCNRV